MLVGSFMIFCPFMGWIVSPGLYGYGSGLVSFIGGLWGVVSTQGQISELVSPLSPQISAFSMSGREDHADDEHPSSQTVGTFGDGPRIGAHGLSAGDMAERAAALGAGQVE